MVLVELENIVKKFGAVVAVDNVSFSVNHGEFFVLLGPSGCGKTTTLRIIAGLEIPDSGRVLFDKRDVTNIPPRLRNVAMVFQSYAVWPHMKVYENIALPLKIKKLPREEIDRRVKQVAEMLNITHLLEKYPFQLSGGERQRVAVARALAAQPDVLLMDEPLSNIDALLRVQARAELKRLQRNLKITTIYVTHDQIEAMVLADRIAVMNKGRVMQIGTPDDVYKRPQNKFVAHFIGTPPMNFFEGFVIDEGVDVGFTKIPFRSVPIELLGRRVTIGVRPSDIEIKPVENGIPLKGTIILIENLGDEYISHIDVGGVILRVQSRTRFHEGEEITIYLSRDKLHIFDESEKRIELFY